MSTHRIASVAAAAMLAGCGASSFQGGKKAAQPLDTSKDPASQPAKQPGTVKGNQSDVKPAPFNPTQPAAPTAETPVSGDLCAGRSTPLRVFIIDLKSGWFAGDGGDTFRGFTSAPEGCATQVEIVYAHVTSRLVEGNILAAKDAGALLSCLAPGREGVSNTTGPGGVLLVTSTKMDTDCEVGDLSSFQQVWILSGSEADRADARLSSPLIQSLGKNLADRAARPAPFGVFFGAGLGNTEHANALARVALPAAFGTSGVFKPGASGEIGTLPNPLFFRTNTHLDPLKAGAGEKPGTFKATHSLFGGLAMLSDAGRVNSSAFSVLLPGNGFTGDGRKGLAEGSCYGDAIAAPGLELLATDACGQKVIASATFAGGTRVVLDANMSRFYTTEPSAWFNRIVNWLAAAKK